MLDLETIEEQLLVSLQSDSQSNTAQPPAPLPRNTPTWLLSSVLQKAIRRGDVSYAVTAATYLAELDPVRLWRRMVVISLEDVGLGDLETAAHVVWVSGKRVWRQKHGGEVAFARLMAKRLAQAPKSRDADDLLVWAGMHSDYQETRKSLAHLDENQLSEIVADEDRWIGERTIAGLYLAGTARLRGFDLAHRYGSYKVLAGVYEQIGVPPDLLQVTTWAANKQTEAHPVSLPLIWLLNRCERAEVRDESALPLDVFEGIPTPAVDMHTRSGKQAISLYLSRSRELRVLLGSISSQERAARIVGCAVFRVEGHCVDRRVYGVGTQHLMHTADVGLVGGNLLGPDHVRAVLDTVRDELPLLNEARRDVLGSTGG